MLFPGLRSRRLTHRIASHPSPGFVPHIVPHFLKNMVKGRAELDGGSGTNIAELDVIEILRTSLEVII